MLRFTPISETHSVVDVTVHTEAARQASNRVAFICLDNSGSMSGEPLTRAKEGAKIFIEQCSEAFNQIYVLVYNTDTTVHEVRDVSSASRFINGIRSQGCTSFTELFKTMRRLLKPINTRSDVYVTLFTDGKHFTNVKWQLFGGRIYENTLSSRDRQRLQDAEVNDKQTFAQSKSQLRQMLARFPNSWVKTRAFSNDVDVPLMEELTNFGCQSGDFRYAFTSEEIASILVDDPDLVTTTTTVQMNGSSLVLRETSPGVFTTRFIMPTAELDECSIIIDGQPADLQVECADDFTSVVDAKTFEFSSALRDISGRIVQDKSRTAVDELSGLEDAVSMFMKTSGASKRLQRKYVKQKMFGLLENINDIRAAAADVVRGSITNASLARILHAGHQASKTRNQKRLDKLAITGAVKLEEQDSKLMQMSEDHDAVFMASLQELETCPMRCMINLSDVPEVIQDTDCLCLTGWMSRPEVAICDPSRIKIEEFYSPENVVAWSVFSDELLAKIERNSPEEQARLVHTGFTHPKFKHDRGVGVMDNAYRGKLNFAVPLYIHPAHWEVVKHYIPRVFAWMSTLDFAAQSFDQIKAVPFSLVMQALLKYYQSKTQANLQSLLSMMRLAKACVDEFNLKHCTTDFVNWQTSYEFRVPKHVPHVELFLMKLLFMKDMPELTVEFYRTVVEEMLRRHYQKKEFITQEFVAEQSSYSQYVNTKIDSGVADEAAYAAALGVSVETKSEYQRPMFGVDKLVVDTPAITKKLERAAKVSAWRYINMFKSMYEFWREVRHAVFDKFDGNYGMVDDAINAMFDPLEFSHDKYTCDKIYEEYQMSPLELYSMLTWNSLHADNKKREAFKGSADPTDVLVELTTMAIQEAEARILAAHAGSENAKLAQMFCLTDNLFVAAGILKQHCANQGDQSFHHFKELLQEHIAYPHRKEKIKMLVDGEYNGKRLYREDTVWDCNRINAKRFVRAYNWQYGKEETLGEWRSSVFVNSHW